MCFKLTDRKEGVQFVRASIWNLTELFLLLLHILIGMKYQSNKKKEIGTTAFRREVGRTALHGFCHLKSAYSL